MDKFHKTVTIILLINLTLVGTSIVTLLVKLALETP